MILHKAESLLLSGDPITNSSECIDVIICLQIVTGRRFNEIAEHAIFSPHLPYQCWVQGLLKESDIDCQVHLIPILISFDIIKSNIARVRTWTQEHIIPDNYTKKRSMALFGFPLIHGSIRNLYLELAYHFRSMSGFYPGATRSFFDMKALCHQEKLTSTMSYQKLVFA